MAPWPAAPVAVQGCRVERLGAMRYLAEQIARDDIAAGRVVDLTPGRHLDVPLYWQYWRLESTVLSALTAAVRAAAVSALR